MNLQAVREELATHAPEGWNVYTTFPGNATTPCVVVGMPEVSYTDQTTYKTLPSKVSVFVITGPQFNEAAESKVLEGAVATANAYRAVRTGTSFRMCRVTGISEVGPTTIGSTEVYQAAVQLDLLINV